MILLAGALALWGIIQINSDQSWMRWSLPGTVVAICVALFAHWGSPHLNARRQFRSTPSAQEPISLDVNDEGMHFRSATMDASVSWNHYCKWSEDESVFVLFTSAILFVLIPKRAFDRDKVVLFKEILCQKIRG